MGIQENLAAILQELKNQRGISTVAFADELGISRSSMQDYLSSKGNPSILTIEYLARLARKLDVEPICLVSSSFSNTQIEVLFLLLRSFEALSGLNTEQRRRFAALLADIIALWEAADHEKP